ncbi:hypothetical protein Q7C36_023571 [Tachysurus vachellii]|uniref:Uncharacterized protein n=1 Tax=Tachysurus vachellii TaxID=175792 RepID=A0AA88IF60_TACVA|nr:hypothetical protein Q7C36_023571 [Tachysurus vachellii]
MSTRFVIRCVMACVNFTMDVIEDQAARPSSAPVYEARTSSLGRHADMQWDIEHWTWSRVCCIFNIEVCSSSCSESRSSPAFCSWLLIFLLDAVQKPQTLTVLFSLQHIMSGHFFDRNSAAVCGFKQPKCSCLFGGTPGAVCDSVRHTDLHRPHISD